MTWFKRIPTKELIGRGVLPVTTDRVTLLDQTLKFFGVASVEAWPEGWSDGQFAFRKSHQAALNDVMAFAEQIGIAPGIVVGRLQYEKIIAYSCLTDLKATFEWA